MTMHNESNDNIAQMMRVKKKNDKRSWKITVGQIFGKTSYLFLYIGEESIFRTFWNFLHLPLAC